MKLIEVLKDIDYEIIKGDINTQINNLCYNSKNIMKNDAFIALIGHNSDGHNYINNAIEKGANVIFVSKDVDIKENITVIKLKNTRESLSYLSSNLFGNPKDKLKIIGIHLQK